MTGSSRSTRAAVRAVAFAGLAIATIAVPAAAGAAHAAPADALPDYVVTSVNQPPATAERGDRFNALDTSTNNGGDASATSQNLYYLSLDQAVDEGDTVLGGRGVLALAAGASSSGGISALVPAAMPFGRYYVITCADGSNNVAESDETNNCVASTKRVSIVAPDFTMTSVGNPPTEAQRGDAFAATDTVMNIGKGDATGTAFTIYYFSKNAKLDAHDPVVGARGFDGLAVGASSAGGLNAHVPDETAAGYYYVLACADGYAQVAESNENNNCAISATQVFVTVPDYFVPTVPDPPATASRGTSFEYTDTLENGGTSALVTSTNAYYLSIDRFVDDADVQFAQTAEVGALPGGGFSFDDLTLTVPAHIKRGRYHVIVCADSTNVLAEKSETNNCHASTGTVQVVAAAARPAVHVR